MADIATYERDVGRAHPDYFAEFLGRMAEARAGVAAVLGDGRRPRSRLTHATTDGMNAASLLPDWRHGRPDRDHDPRARRRPRPAVRAARAVRRRDRVRGRRRRTATTTRPLAAFDAAITPGTRLVSLSHVLWTTGAVMPVARDRGAGPRPRRVRRRRRRPGRRRDPVPVRRARRGLPTPCRPRSGCSGRRGWARSWSIRARSSGSSRRSAAGSPSRRRTAPVGRAGGPTAAGSRRPASTGRRSSGMARSIGWLSMFVGPRVRLPTRDGDGRGGRGAPRRRSRVSRS